jgi:hypothetical protein
LDIAGNILIILCAYNINKTPGADFYH